MGSSEQLIQELDAEGAAHWLAVLVVALKDENVFIASVNEDRLKTLNDAVEGGGVPLGIIAADREPRGAMRMKARVLSEHLGRTALVGAAASLSRRTRARLVGKLDVREKSDDHGS